MAVSAFVGFLFGAGWGEGDFEQEQSAKEVMVAKNVNVTKKRRYDVIGRQDVIRGKKVKKELNFLPCFFEISKIR